MSLELIRGLQFIGKNCSVGSPQRRSYLVETILVKGIHDFEYRRIAKITLKECRAFLRVTKINISGEVPNWGKWNISNWCGITFCLKNFSNDLERDSNDLNLLQLGQDSALHRKRRPWSQLEGYNFTGKTAQLEALDWALLQLDLCWYMEFIKLDANILQKLQLWYEELFRGLP